MKEIDELFSRGIATCIDPDGLFRKKIEQKMAGTHDGEIVIKLGVDPTRPDIHLGHAVLLRKLRAFQDIGCKVIFLIGDYTSQIGDPTGKSKTRPEISQAEIEANMKTYLDQVGKILRVDDPKLFSWIRNSDWFLDVTDISAAPGATVTITGTEGHNITVDANSFVGKAALFETTRMQKTALKRDTLLTVSFTRVLSILRHVTHARLIERDMFQDRITGGSELYMHEMLYPVMQGIDSAILAQIYGSCDLEIGGTDQTFNMLMGRDVMRMHKQPEQAVMSMDILEGLDGKEKMSKSLGNYVALTDEPADMYGKIMSIPDSVMFKYFRLATPMPEEQVKELEESLNKPETNPKNIKMKLAWMIVSMYHTPASASVAEALWTATFSKKQIPETAIEITGDYQTIVDAMMKAEVADSKSDARRLVEAGSVTHLESGNKIKEPTEKPEKGTYRVGKIRFFKVV